MIHIVKRFVFFLRQPSSLLYVLSGNEIRIGVKRTDKVFFGFRLSPNKGIFELHFGVFLCDVPIMYENKKKVMDGLNL